MKTGELMRRMLAIALVFVMLGGMFGWLPVLASRVAASPTSFWATSEGDRIGDTPYTINADADDHELMEPFQSDIVGTGLADSPWPMFQHDAYHTGRSQHSVSNDLAKRWEFELSGYSASPPTIGPDGTIYVGTAGTQLVDGSSVVGGSLIAINPDGTKKWEFVASGKVGSAPAIASDGTIYITAWGDFSPDTWQAPRFYAINPNGSLKWEFTTSQHNSSSPAIAPNGKVYMASYDHKLYAFHPNGTKEWEFLAGDSIASSPAIGQDGTIYVGSGDGRLYAINPDGSGRWYYQTGGRITYSPTIGGDGTIYVSSGDRKLHALKPDGSLKWEFDAGVLLGDIAISHDGNIYVGTEAVPHLDVPWGMYSISPLGVLRWFFELPNSSTPIIDSTGMILAGGFGSGYGTKFVAISPDGIQRWELILDMYDQINSPGVIAGESVLYIAADILGPPFKAKIYAFSARSVADGAPKARASEINQQPQIMFPDTQYTVKAKYSDPDGREDLKYCYLQLRHPDKPLTMMWYQATGHAAPWAGEEGENYLTIVSVDATAIEEGGLQGYEVAWTFTIKDTWPEVEDAIDFGVQAWDDSDLQSGWDYDNTKASFRLVVNHPPDLPSELRQYNPWQGGNVKVGAEIGTAIDYNVIVLGAQVTDPDNDKVMLEAEVTKLDDGQVKTLQMDYLVNSGEEAHVFFVAESGNYAWRARAIDEYGQPSEWVEFGENNASETDFDYGFEPHPYGYKFQNRAVEPGTLTGGVGKNFPKFWEEYIIEGDNWVIFRETFDLEGIDEETQIAWVKEFMLDGKIFGGCCYGMASSSVVRYVYPELLRSHYGQFDNVIRESDHVIWNLSNPPAADINGDGYAGWLGNDIGTKPVLRAILSFQLSQYGTAAQKAMSDARDNSLESPAEILDTLGKALPNRGQQMGAMHVLVIGYEIHTKKPLGGTKKEAYYHAVVPYKVVDNRIYVYDNNHPDVNGDEEKGQQDRAYSQYIEIDRANDTWKYNFSGSTYWPAQSATIRYIGLLSLDTLYSEGQLPKPVGTGGNEAVISSTGSGDLLLTDSEGRSTGFEHGWLVEEIPGVRPVYTCDASLEDPGEAWRQAYYTAYDTELLATIQGREDGFYSVTKFGPEYFATISDVIISEGETDELLLSSDRIAIRLHGNQAPKTYMLILNKNRDGVSQTIAAVSIPIAGSAVHEYTIDWDALYQGEDGVLVSVDEDGDGEYDHTFTAGSELTGDQFVLCTETTIDFDPGVLNLRARGGVVTVYIELPEGFDVHDIDISTILLNGTVPALSRPTSVGDYNNNGIPDLMVKFDRRAVQAILDVGQSVEITITGEVDGTPFMGVDTIRVTG